MPNRKLLVVAYHYPPTQGSTGTLRTVALSNYLREHGWDISVLSIQTRAHQHTSDENLSLIPRHVRVHRAWGFDARNRFAIFGKYPGFLALPDRWQSWVLGGFFRGAQIIRTWKPDAIFSTFPIASAHAIGWLLSKKYNIPWIAEFRDPMLQTNDPTAEIQRKAFRAIERKVFRYAKEVIVTTEGCRKLYLDRYPQWDSSKITTVSNGYDPQLFDSIKPSSDEPPNKKTVFLHSGILYPIERNPTAFFDAIDELRREGFFDTCDVEFRFRASGDEEEYERIIGDLGITAIVRFLPKLNYLRALEEMKKSDVLMIFQSSDCNNQIPAKIYEYMICQKPILALTDPAGETGQLLTKVGVDQIARLDSSLEIKSLIKAMITQLESGQAFVVPKAIALGFSRRTLTAKVNDVITRAIEKP